MSEYWINFVVVISVQCLLFVVHAHYEKKIQHVPRILLYSATIGMCFGVAFDLLIGKYIGIFSYMLGFSYSFLIVNGALSYGLMLANTLLMKDAHPFHFYLWSVCVGSVYEITNFFFPVWSWEFGTPEFEYFVVIALAYCGLAYLMALTAHFCMGTNFRIIGRTLQLKS